jgi:FtsP/CotA-like multicopper oxidase with cupredoxin domain
MRTLDRLPHIHEASMLHLLAVLLAIPGPVRAETVAPNDNRAPAGALTGRVLSVSLEARTGTWYPEGEQSRGLEVAAWGEPGKPLLTPGPLIRATVGTTVRVTLSNSLTRRLTVFGLGKIRGLADSLILEPGARKEVEFSANAPGTYYYVARSAPDPFGGRQPEDGQLHGAIVIDPGAAAPTGCFHLLVVHHRFHQPHRLAARHHGDQRTVGPIPSGSTRCRATRPAGM